MTAIRNFKFYIFYLPIKNKQALHKIIRVLSPSIIFVEFSFKPVYLTLVVKISKFIENYNAWEMSLQVKIMALDIFIHTLPPIPSITPINPAVKYFPQVLSSLLKWPQLGISGYLYLIWFLIFSNMITLQFCKQNNYQVVVILWPLLYNHILILKGYIR